jgi:hypothetical protein
LIDLHCQSHLHPYLHSNQYQPLHRIVRTGSSFSTIASKSVAFKSLYAIGNNGDATFDIDFYMALDGTMNTNIISMDGVGGGGSVVRFPP